MTGTRHVKIAQLFLRGEVKGHKRWPWMTMGDNLWCNILVWLGLVTNWVGQGSTGRNRSTRTGQNSVSEEWILAVRGSLIWVWLGFWNNFGACSRIMIMEAGIHGPKRLSARTWRPGPWMPDWKSNKEATEINTMIRSVDRWIECF